MPSFCSICEFKWTRYPNSSYHKFNFSRPEILKEWTDFVRKVKAKEDWTPSRWSSICSRHFLPSCFKVQKEGAIRKHLKADAVPTIVTPNAGQDEVPPVEESLTDATDSSVQLQGAQCRLCTQIIANQGGLDIFNYPLHAVLEWIEKFLPFLNILPDDCLTKSVCSICFKRLEEFNQFAENAIQAQHKLCSTLPVSVGNPDDRPLIRPSIDLNRVMKIKQEPIVNIKEENHVLNPQSEFSEQQVEDFENFNSLFDEFCRGQILEITDLPNDLINLADDDDEVDNDEIRLIEDEEINIKPNIVLLKDCEVAPIALINPRHMKQERIVDGDKVDLNSSMNISNEHSYCKHTIPLVDGIVSRVKTEKKEDAIPSPTNLRIPKIYIIDNALIKHKCDHCGGLYETKSMLLDHQRRVHDRFLCSVCNSRFENFPKFYFHKLNCCYRPNYGMRCKKYWRCDDCSSFFSLKLGIENHQKRGICVKILRIRSESKARKQRRRKNKAIEVRENYACEICNKIFIRRSNLNQHKLTHTTQRTFTCSLCPSAFKRSSGLSAHHKSFHLKLRPFQCDVCQRTFALKADMQRCRHNNQNAMRRRPVVMTKATTDAIDIDYILSP